MQIQGFIRISSRRGGDEKNEYQEKNHVLAIFFYLSVTNLAHVLKTLMC